MNKLKILIPIIPSFLLGTILMYWYSGRELEFKNKTESLVFETKQIRNQQIPECFAERCPEYFSMTVDKDVGWPSASVVIIPTAMTQGAGKIMIIKKGKVIFETPEMPGIGIDSVENGDGFILHYSNPRDENLNNVNYSVRYRYRDGQFEPETSQK